MKKKSIVKKAAKPAAVPAKKTPAKVVKKTAATPVKRSVAPVAKSAKKVPVTKVAKTKAPAVKETAPKSRVTAITALIDVGFGNTLYVRGEGAGLSWDKGVALDCTGDTQWSISLPASGEAIVFKFLLNDISWSSGADYLVEAGGSATVEPSF